MDVGVREALDSTVRTIATQRTIQSRTALFLLVSVVVMAGWLARRRSPAAATWRAVDGARAFEDLQNVVKFGPRPPGSVALREARQYISMGLAADGIGVWHDNFTASTPAGDIAMTNVIGVVPGESSSIVVAAGRYDTARPEGIRFVRATMGDRAPRCCWS